MSAPPRAPCRARDFLCGQQLAVLVALVGLILGSWPGRLRAEATPLTKWHDGGIYLTVNRPSVQLDGARIDCAPTTAGCQSLNLSACDGGALPIDFTLGPPLSQAAAAYAGGTQTLYAFLSRSPSCIYSSNAAQVAENGVLLGTNAGLPSSSIFFLGGSQPFGFPRDVTAANANGSFFSADGTFLTTTLMQALGVCPAAGGSPVNLTRVYLCVGVDGSGTKGGVNNTGQASTSSQATTTSSSASSTDATTSSVDLVGYLALQVDTQPPATPTSLTVVPKNGRVELKVTYDTSLLDVDSLEVHFRPAASQAASSGNNANDANDALGGGNTTDPGADCLSWPLGATRTVRGQSDGNVAFAIGGLTNGSSYEFCAATADYLQNKSVPTAPTSAEPREECDLFACFPGDLRVGYCAAGELPSLYSLAATGIVLGCLRRRRRGTQSGPKRGFTRGLLLLALVPSAAHADERAPWIQSESPTAGDHHLPAGEAQDTYRAELEAERRAPISFGDPRQQRLDYGRERPLVARGSVDLTVGPYRPQIGEGEPSRLFGLIYAERRHGTWFRGHPLRYRLTGSWYPFAGLTTGPYGAIGLWRASAPSRLCVANDGQPVPCTATTVFSSVEGNDTAAILALPLSLGWQHTQNLARLVRIPLSVGARVGLVANLWWGQSGGRSATVGGRRAAGNTVNAEFAANLAFNLNELSKRRQSARTQALLVAEAQFLPNGALLGSQRRHRLSFGAPYVITLGIRAQFLANH